MFIHKDTEGLRTAMFIHNDTEGLRTAMIIHKDSPISLLIP